MADKPVLLCAGSFIHSQLYHALSEYYRIAFFNEDFAQMAQNSGFNCINTDTYISWDMGEEAKSKSMWMMKQVMDKMEEDPDWGIDMEHEMLHGELFSIWFPPWFHDRVSKMMAKIFGVSVLHEREGIAGILMHEDVTAGGKSMVGYGKSEGLPTLHLAHANHFMKPGTTDIHCRVVSDYIGASGLYMKDWYMKCGAKEEQIELIGFPQWDQYYRNDGLPKRDEARRAFGFEEDELVITFAATWPQMVTAGGQAWERSIKVLDETYQRYLEAIKNLNAKTIIKIHPTGGPGREDYYKEYMEKNDVHGAITREYNQWTIAAADCVVTQTSSNFAFESLAMNVPAVELYTPGSRMPGIPGTYGDGLEDIIMQAIKDGVDREILRQMNYDDDGNAMIRAVDWVRQLCS